MKLIVVMLLLCGMHASAQSGGPSKRREGDAAQSGAPAQSTDLETVVQQAKQAAGGSAWDDIRTMHLRFQSTAGGLSGSSEQWIDVPSGRNVTRVSRPPTAGAHGFDGVSAWTQDAAGYSYVFGDEDARQGAVDEAYRLSMAFWFPERGAATLASAPPHHEGEKTYDVVSVTPQGGRPFTIWIDQTTHLIDRFIEQQGEDVQIIRCLDYREAQGGIRMPFTVRFGDGEEQWEEVNALQAVQVNEPFAPELFSLPANPLPDYTFENGAASTTLPFRLVDNKLIVDIQLNGQGPVAAEVDSGGNYIVQPALAERLGLVGQGAAKSGGGGEGFVATSKMVVDTVGIGELRLTKQFYKILAFNKEKPDLSLLGLQVFERFVVGIDFDAHTLTLTRPEAFSYHGDGQVVPFYFQDNQPEVKGSIDGIAGVFAIDTGDAGSLLLIAPFAKRYGLVERYKAVIPYGGSAVGGATYGLMARSGVLSLFGADDRPIVEVHDLPTRISQQKGGFDADRYVSGNVGIGALSQFNLVFDYAHHRIIFEKNKSYGRRVPFNRTGLQLQADGAGWKVLDVATGSPGAELGIKPGDKITSINGLGSAQLGRGANATLFTQEAGTRLVLALHSDAGERTAILTLRDVL